MSPESNESSSAVTVWARELMLVHSTVSPGSTSSEDGENAWNWMFDRDAAAATPGQRRARRPRRARRRARPHRPLDAVQADHAAHHVILDVAVVEPRAGIALAPAEAEALRRARRSGCRGCCPARVFQRWPWTWKVWWSEPIAITSHCTRCPTRRAEDRRVPDERAAVDRHEVRPERREHDLELAVGQPLVAAAEREHPEHPAVDRVLHRRRVVVVGPHADRVAAHGQAVRVLLAELHVAVLAGEARHERAVRARPVVDAVEVHRVRVLAQAVHVLEVDPQLVAHARADQRAGDQRCRPSSTAARSRPACRQCGLKRR